ncbi:hypothetical protein Tco_1526594 [Tanacetum coccineum]
MYQPSTSQQPVYQAQPYQATAQQMQGVSKTDFENYVKANDAFVNSNTASSSNSGSLPSNTVTNPKEDLKGITTRSGTAYQGPTIPTSSPRIAERRTENPVTTRSGTAYQGPTIPTSSPRIAERRTEVTKDTVFLTNNGITKDVQPPVVPVENQNPVSEPDVVLVSALMPNQKSSIPYPSR